MSLFSTGVLGGFALGCSSSDDDADDPLRSGEYDVERYELRGEYDWSRDRLTATVNITLSTLEADINVVVLDSAVQQIASVRAEGAALPFTIGEGSLTVDISSLSDRERGVVLSIDYEAASGDALRAVPPRAGDPVDARVVYTLSEPEDARRWMPCHDRPDDRAFFSIEMRMDAGERLISNGDLLADDTDESGRVMSYSTQYELPTYLMAFAISDFEVTSADADGLPISVWRRRGVNGEYEEVVDELVREMGIFEGLLGPYPFEKYALVMLPDFGGGIEHAGITFQGESSTAQPSLSSDVSLTAHELGHQWFGDLVTVATWDDLWIKEGMATLLAEQAVRVFEDQGGAGTLSGDAWYVVSGDAIRDTSLAPPEKYTTGPYDRAAWLYTQIRGVVGEDVFWSTLRGILEDHRFGSVSTDEVLEAFAPALGPDATERARRAVDAKDLPSIEVAPSDSIGAVVTLHDPEEILVAPIEIEWLHGDGTTSRKELVPEEPMELSRATAADFLVLDPGDVHPSFWRLLADDGGASAESFAEDLAPLRLPVDEAQLGTFSALAGAHQLAALYDGWPSPVAPADFESFKASLDAESAKAVSIETACIAADAETDPAVKAEWVAVLEAALVSGPPSMGVGYVSNYGACSELVPPLELFAAEWADLEAGLTTEDVSEERLTFLAKLVLPPADALDAWGNTASSAYSLRARSIAARHLRGYADQLKAIAPDAIPAWRASINELLVSSETYEVLRSAIPATVPLGGETASENADALAALSDILHTPVTHVVHPLAVCTADELTKGDAAAWDAFVADLEDATLSDDVRDLLANPDQC